jgi:deoxyribonuclease-4
MDLTLLGSHLSRNSLTPQLVDYGIKTVQVNTSAPRNWVAPLSKPDDSFIKESNLNLIVHSPYLVNPSSVNKEVREKTVKSLVAEIKQCFKIGALGLVVHAGHPGGDGDANTAIENWVEVVNNLPYIPDQYNESGGETNFAIFIENTANGKASPGRDLQSWKNLISEVQKVTKYKVSGCFDTCHSYAGGLGEVPLQEIIETLNGVGVVHLNDSRDSINSGRDRHANLGKGTMNSEYLLQTARFALENKIPVILETPNSNNEQKKELQWLKQNLI